MATTHTHTGTVVGERKANGGDYGPGMGRWVTVTVLAPSRRRANARGYTGAKRGWGTGNPRTAKRAKRQGNERMGRVPHVVTTNWSNV